MNPILHQLANGRRLASRSLIMGALSAFEVTISRKVVVDTPENENRDEVSWGGIGTLNEVDEHAFDYVKLGHGRLMMDRFTGGNMLDNNSMVDGENATMTAIIEPYDDELPEEERAINIPDFEPKEGDLVALLIDPKLIIFLEVVSVLGGTMIGDFGKRYLLNKRDELTYREPFATEITERV